MSAGTASDSLGHKLCSSVYLQEQPRTQALFICLSAGTAYNTSPVHPFVSAGTTYDTSRVHLSVCKNSLGPKPCSSVCVCRKSHSYGRVTFPTTVGCTCFNINTCSLLTHCIKGMVNNSKTLTSLYKISKHHNKHIQKSM